MSFKKIRLIDLTQCYNCYGCETACKKRHSHQRNIRDGKKLKHFVLTITCRQCEDPICVTSCKKGAQVKENGISYIIPEKCIGCGLCAKKCPYQSIQMVDRPINKKAEVKKPKKLAVKCDRCRGFKDKACLSGCPSGALDFVEATFCADD